MPHGAPSSPPHPKTRQLCSGRERLYAPLHVTPCTWVDTEAALTQMHSKLRNSAEFACDLESHSYRTYRGFVCLMQVWPM